MLLCVFEAVVAREREREIKIKVSYCFKTSGPETPPSGIPTQKRRCKDVSEKRVLCRTRLIVSSSEEKMSSINTLAVFAWPRGRLFPVASPLERFWRASFGVFCCSLFIVFNRKGTTTSSDKKARSRDRRNETTRTRTRTLTIFFLSLPNKTRFATGWWW